MLVVINKSCKTINLDRFDFIRAYGKNVEAWSGDIHVTIATCAKKENACDLEQAISNAWVKCYTAFDVDTWCSEHNVDFR